MLTYTQFLTETLGSPVAWQWAEKHPYKYSALFTVGEWNYRVDLKRLSALIVQQQRLDWVLEFAIDNFDHYDKSTASAYGVLGTGHAFTVFATVIVILKDFIRRNPDTNSIEFHAEEPSRVKLYNRLIGMVQTELPGFTGLKKAGGWYEIYPLRKSASH